MQKQQGKTTQKFKDNHNLIAFNEFDDMITMENCSELVVNDGKYQTTANFAPKNKIFGTLGDGTSIISKGRMPTEITPVVGGRRDDLSSKVSKVSTAKASDYNANMEVNSFLIGHHKSNVEPQISTSSSHVDGQKTPTESMKQKWGAK